MKRANVSVLAAVGALAVAASSARADSAVAWGTDTAGELGNGTMTAYSTVPVPVIGMSSGVTAVGAGNGFGFAIRNGAAYSWGFNNYGALGDGTTANSSVPVAVSGLTSGVTAISGSGLSAFAIQNGVIKTWGYGAEGQLGDGSTANSTTPISLPGTFGTTAIAGGSLHCLALEGGSVLAWGLNSYGQLGNGTGGVNVKSLTPVAVQGMGSSQVSAIAAGGAFSMAIRKGALLTWGGDYEGQLGNGTYSSQVYGTPTAVASLSSGVTAIAAGGEHSLAVKDGNVYAWGYNDRGQVGTGTINYAYPFYSTPVLVLDTTANILSVAATSESSYAVSADGSLWVWGDNTYGELGLGNTSSFNYAPQHLLAPVGYAYTRIAGDSDSDGNVVATLATLASLGDLNGDNKIDISDLTLLANNFGKSGSSLAGDINADGKVDISDLTILATHFGLGAASPQLALAEALKDLNLPSVPEPASLALLAIGVPMLRRNRKS